MVGAIFTCIYCDLDAPNGGMELAKQMRMMSFYVYIIVVYIHLYELLILRDYYQFFFLFVNLFDPHKGLCIYRKEYVEAFVNKEAGSHAVEARQRPYFVNIVCND